MRLKYSLFGLSVGLVVGLLAGYFVLLNDDSASWARARAEALDRHSDLARANTRIAELKRALAFAEKSQNQAGAEAFRASANAEANTTQQSELNALKQSESQLRMLLDEKESKRQKLVEALARNQERLNKLKAQDRQAASAGQEARQKLNERSAEIAALAQEFEAIKQDRDQLANTEATLHNRILNLEDQLGHAQGQMEVVLNNLKKPATALGIDLGVRVEKRAE